MLWRFNYLGSGLSLNCYNQCKYSIDTVMLPFHVFVSSNAIIEKQKEIPELLNDANKQSKKNLEKYYDIISVARWRVV